ncbi:hypothetical protein Fot_41557 [Forsythia ovata]|uniref:Uncharacterized protein n=1 Tax=Forsythia ovata TaxID=205694 RepID=A0ABD1RIL7_9LAMI
MAVEKQSIWDHSFLLTEDFTNNRVKLKKQDKIQNNANVMTLENERAPDCRYNYTSYKIMRQNFKSKEPKTKDLQVSVWNSGVHQVKDSTHKLQFNFNTKDLQVSVWNSGVHQVKDSTHKLQFNFNA